MFVSILQLADHELLEFLGSPDFLGHQCSHLSNAGVGQHGHQKICRMDLQGSLISCFHTTISFFKGVGGDVGKMAIFYFPKL